MADRTDSTAQLTTNKPYPYPVSPLRIGITRRIAHFLGDVVLMTLAFRVRITGRENIPQSGPTIAMFNHVTQLDPMLAALPIRRFHLVPLSKIELTKGIFSGLLVWAWHSISIRRGEVDRAALRQALDVLKSDGVLMIAPEGHRNKDGLRNPLEGAALLANQSGAVMLPIGVSGTEHVFKALKRLRRPEILINYGRPFKLQQGVGRKQYGQVMQEIMYQIAPLVEPHLRGNYADLSKATMDTIEYV